MTNNARRSSISSSAYNVNCAASANKCNRRMKGMLSQSQRTTIIELASQGISKREIGRVLGISRVAVRRVLHTQSSEVPELHRAEKAEPYRQQILEQLA